MYRISNIKLSNGEYSEILNNFDPAKHKHVDSFINLDVEPGAIYIFNTTDENCSLMSDAFVNQDFDIKKLKPFFDTDAWKAVQSLHKTCKNLMVCRKCNTVCNELFIKCVNCFNRIHFACDNVSY